VKKLPEINAEELFVKISLSWLSEFVSIKDITPTELAHRLTMSGLEVSGIDDQSQGFENVVIGKLISIAPHPNADKLSLTEVETANGIFRIVCGAKNISPGIIVPVALVGAELPNGLIIKQAKIRGEESNGMICSESELGLAESSEGIMHLPAETPLDASITELLKSNDTVLDIEVTPNRSDCLSHFGIARHLSAILDRPLRLPPISLCENNTYASSTMKVTVESNSGCYRYCARIITDVTVAPSPLWMQRRLENVGIRPVNNIVDVTNYLLMELGHPLHAFDLEKISGNTIIPRKARAHEKIKTLDGVVRELLTDDLVIADAKQPIALAGVMGGQETEVTQQTHQILLESAWFDSSIVRKMSRRTGCVSESSYRFERGTDPENGLLLAIDRAAQLIAEFSGGHLQKGIVDDYPAKIKIRTVPLTLARVSKVLGMQIESKQAISALSRLGFLTEPGQVPGTYTIRIPSFRHDVTIEEDLIEEIAEVIGYDKIPVSNPCMPLKCSVPDPKRDFLQTCRDLAVTAGLTETVQYSFHSPSHFDWLRLPDNHPWRKTVTLKNPISEARSRMRPALLPGLIETVCHNQRRGQERIFLFETGAVFIPNDNGPLPHEPKHLAVAMTGPRHPMHWQLGKKRIPADFYDLKGILESLFTQLYMKAKLRLRAEKLPFLHPMISFTLHAPDGNQLGWAGALHPEAQKHYKLKDTLFIAELDLEALFPWWNKKPSLQRHSRFPVVKRDIALAVSDSTQAGDVIKAIYNVGRDLVRDVVPFDLYTGEGLPEGSKSLAFSLTMQSFEKTLQDEEVNQKQSEIVAHLQKKFKAQQR